MSFEFGFIGYLYEKNCQLMSYASQMGDIGIEVRSLITPDRWFPHCLVGIPHFSHASRKIPKRLICCIRIAVAIHCCWSWSCACRRSCHCHSCNLPSRSTSGRSMSKFFKPNRESRKAVSQGFRAKVNAGTKVLTG